MVTEDRWQSKTPEKLKKMKHRHGRRFRTVPRPLSQERRAAMVIAVHNRMMRTITEESEGKKLYDEQCGEVVKMLEARIAETREKVAVISGDIASLRREKSLLFNELKNVLKSKKSPAIPHSNSLSSEAPLSPSQNLPSPSLTPMVSSALVRSPNTPPHIALVQSPVPQPSPGPTPPNGPILPDPLSHSHERFDQRPNMVPTPYYPRTTFQQPPGQLRQLTRMHLPFRPPPPPGPFSRGRGHMNRFPPHPPPSQQQQQWR